MVDRIDRCIALFYSFDGFCFCLFIGWLIVIHVCFACLIHWAKGYISSIRLLCPRFLSFLL